MSFLIREKMLAAHIPESTIAAFQDHVASLREGQNTWLPESAIAPVRSLLRLEDAVSGNGARPDLLAQLAVVKLNGGLGTSMGLARAKSLLHLRNGECFLDFIARQLLHLRARSGCEAPVFHVMNSFNTHEDTMRCLDKYRARGFDESSAFVQAMVPKICARTYEPISWPDNRDLEWCPPGHGDLYPTLVNSGVLQKLLRDGIRYLFVSNADNLGASVDLTILQYLAESDLSFLMEVAERTSSDVKGGHLVRMISTGRLRLRELAQCRPEDLPAFRDFEQHRYFNTNNLWIRLEGLRDELDRHNGRLVLPLIVNCKTVDPKNSNSPKVLQLETAAGAAIECFDRSGAIVVPRSRFSPVKTTADLLAVRSDAYRETSEGGLILEESRHGEQPVIGLDDLYYKGIADFEAAFPYGPPSLLRCESLKISGPWVFGAGVVCEGRVEFSNPSSEPREVAGGIYRGF